MKKYLFFHQKFFLSSSNILFRCSAIFFSFFIVAFLLTCAGKEMSVEEAKKVTVSMRKESFVPPPRRIDDILAILAEPGQFDQTVSNKFKAKADKFPPENGNNRNLAYFYRERGQAAFMLYRNNQALEDFRKDEQRYVTIGMDAFGRILVVVYTWRDENIRIISARKAVRYEVRQYEGEI